MDNTQITTVPTKAQYEYHQQIAEFEKLVKQTGLNSKALEAIKQTQYYLLDTTTL